MADFDGSGERPKKAHRWETNDGDNEESGGRASNAPRVPASTRWGAGTPQQIQVDTPRTILRPDLSAWRGHSTPTPTAYSLDSVRTPTMSGGMFSGPGSSTPMFGGATPSFGGATPSFAGSTPLFSGSTPMFTGATPAASNAFGATPNYQYEGTTPVQSHFAAGEEQSAITANIEAEAKKLEMQWRMKNKRLTEEYLDSIFPPEFTIVQPPADYNPLPPDEPNFYELATKSRDVFVIHLNNTSAEAAATFDIPDSLGDGMPTMQPKDAPVFEILLKYHNVDPVPDEVLLPYLLMKHLFKIKNGDASQRRSSTRYLLDKAKVFGSSALFQYILHVWRSDILSLQEQHYYVDLMKGIITRLQRQVRQSSTDIIHTLSPLLSSPEAVTREDVKEVIAQLTRVIGHAAVFDAIKDDFAHRESDIRRNTAKVIGVVAFASGVDCAMEIIEGVVQSPVAAARTTAARCIAEVATRVRHGVTSALSTLAALFTALLTDEPRVKREAALALALVAEAVAPYGIEELSPLVPIVREECKRGIGSTSGPFVRAFGSLVPLMAPHDAQHYTADMMPTLVSQFNTPEDEHRRAMLQVVRQCVTADGVTADFIRSTIVQPFFSGFWTVRRVAAERRTAAVLIDTTVAMGKKLGSNTILQYLVQDMKDDDEQFQRMVVETVKRVVESDGTIGVPEDLVVMLLDGAISALRQDETGLNRTVLEGLAAVCISLGSRLKPYLEQIFEVIKSRQEMPEEMIRMQAGELVARIAPAVMKADGWLFLQNEGRTLFERMTNEDPAALSASLKATRVILQELGKDEYRPPVNDLLVKLKDIVRNRNSNVQLNTILLVEEIATNCHEAVAAIHLHELTMKGLFELLDADRRETRRACTRTFGIIAKKLSPFEIILELVDNFKQDKRKIRICTAVALGSIAKECGALTVIPYLLNEYRLSEGEQVATIIQHSILKAIRYMFEYIGAVGKEYVYPLVPLLERALTETEIQQRRMAVEAVHAIINAVAGNDGFQDVVVHLLNLVQPNIVELLSKREAKIGEERLKLVTAVVSVYESARLVVGSQVVFQYLLQGMFHPAKKVRDIYRRTYNMIYMASPEALVPIYPPLPPKPTPAAAAGASSSAVDPYAPYRRYELEAVL